MKTKEQILAKHGFYVEVLKSQNPECANSLLEAMDEYSEQQCGLVQDLFNRPTEQLKPLEDLYRKEHPYPEGRFYMPDRTKFYKWITSKILGNN